jgi:predicted amidophosphoribosyltransferase
MIEIDPRWYFPASYLFNWSCPSCGERVPVVNGALEHEHCPHCAAPLTHEVGSIAAARLSA